jgi:hypothetical protein
LASNSQVGDECWQYEAANAITSSRYAILDVVMLLLVMLSGDQNEALCRQNMPGYVSTHLGIRRWLELVSVFVLATSGAIGVDNQGLSLIHDTRAATEHMARTRGPENKHEVN